MTLYGPTLPGDVSMLRSLHAERYGWTRVDGPEDGPGDGSSVHWWTEEPPPALADLGTVPWSTCKRREKQVKYKLSDSFLSLCAILFRLFMAQELFVWRAVEAHLQRPLLRVQFSRKSACAD